MRSTRAFMWMNEKKIVYLLYNIINETVLTAKTEKQNP